MEKILQADRINQIHDAASGSASAGEYFHRVLDFLEIRVQLPREDLARIPREGPLLVVCNHPFGAIDGIVLGAILSTIRPDMRMMANYLLDRIPELHQTCIFVDPFGGESAAMGNVAGMRQCLRWLKGGGLLTAFPAGEVAHFSAAHRRIREPDWNSTIARIARKAGVPVLPVFFDGTNSAAFHALGLLHPKLRTAMLGREVWNKRGRRIDVRVGTVIPAPRLREFEDDDRLAAHLRQRTLVLRHRVNNTAPPAPVHDSNTGKNAVVDTVPAALLAHDIDRLEAAAKLVDGDEFEVY